MSLATSQADFFYAVDRSTNQRYLVDTGAAVSVLPTSANDKLYPSSIKLVAANSTPIATYGLRSVTESRFAKTIPVDIPDRGCFSAYSWC